MKKEDLTKLLLLHKNDWQNEEEFKKFYDYKHANVEELHEIGKYYEAPDDGFKVTHDLSDEDTEFKVITHESIKAIIRQYAAKHLEYLKKCAVMDKDLDERGLYEREHGYMDGAQQYVEKQIREWEKAEILLYDIDLDNPRLVKSWSYQFELFELLRIYKTFDRENDVVIYEGY